MAVNTLTIEEADALRVQFAKGKNRAGNKRRRWNLGFRILAQHRVTETQYLADVLPLAKLPQEQETQPRGWRSAAANVVRREHQQARSAKCDQSIHLGHKLLQNNLSKPAVGSKKHSRRSCTQQQQQQQPHKEEQEEQEATVTAAKQ